MAEAKNSKNWQAKVLVPAARNNQPIPVSGVVQVCTVPLSLWGGLDPKTGEVIDRRHPQSGEVLSGKVVFLPFGRGSSSASSILLEAVKLETAPAAFVLNEVYGILALGAAVARELYGASPAILELSSDDWNRASCCDEVSIDEAGVIRSLA